MLTPRPIRPRGAATRRSTVRSALLAVPLAALLAACAGGAAEDPADDAVDSNAEDTADNLLEDAAAADGDVEDVEQAATDDDVDPEDGDPDGADPDQTDPAEEAPPLEPLQGLALETVAEGFDGPVGVATEPDSERLAVIERTGRAWLVDPDSGVLPEPLLDLSGQVTAASIEQGLLGLAYWYSVLPLHHFVFNGMLNGMKQAAEREGPRASTTAATSP